jgi:hypothetical protein
MVIVKRESALQKYTKLNNSKAVMGKERFNAVETACVLHARVAEVSFSSLGSSHARFALNEILYDSYTISSQFHRVLAGRRSRRLAHPSSKSS